MHHRVSLFWPLVLIGAGVLWMLIQLGVMPAANLWALTYLWPVVLIGIGVGIIARPYWRWAMPLASLLTVSALFLGVLFAGQLGWNRVPGDALGGGPWFDGGSERGSGKVITEKREVQDMTSIRISYPGTYLIRQGTAESLTIEAEDNVVAAMRTNVSNHVLSIDGDRGSRRYIAATQPVKVTITVKDLQDVRFESAGELTIQKLKAESLNAALDGAGTLRLEGVELKALEAVLSGVGSMHADGSADQVMVRVDGLGSFEGADLKTSTATVTLDGLGSADVWADMELTATVNGLGSVKYYGTPQVHKSVNGLGTVQGAGAK